MIWGFFFCCSALRSILRPGPAPNENWSGKIIQRNEMRERGLLNQDDRFIRRLIRTESEGSGVTRGQVSKECGKSSTMTGGVDSASPALYKYTSLKKKTHSCAFKQQNKCKDHWFMWINLIFYIYIMFSLKVRHWLNTQTNLPGQKLGGGLNGCSVILKAQRN